MVSKQIAALGCAVVVLGSTLHAQLSLPPETNNAALRYWMAFALMQDPPAEPATADLLAQVSAGDADWDEARLGPILDLNAGALGVMQRATTLPLADWGVEYSLGPSAPIVHLPKARVLSRLNTLHGHRLLAMGDVSRAADTWLTGLRFTLHIAAGGSLISVLSARTAFVANARALGDTVGRLPNQMRSNAARELAMMPADVFDWSAAMSLEARLLLSGVQPRTTANPDLPTLEQIDAFTRFAEEVVSVFRESPEVTARQLASLEADRATLHPLLQALPLLARVNTSRAELRQVRQRLLDALTQTGP